MPRRILLTLLVVALVLSLFWCWQLFGKPIQNKLTNKKL
jgi:hypothetical protein